MECRRGQLLNCVSSETEPTDDSQCRCGKQPTNKGTNKGNGTGERRAGADFCFKLKKISQRQSRQTQQRTAQQRMKPIRSAKRRAGAGLSVEWKTWPTVNGSQCRCSKQPTNKGNSSGKKQEHTLAFDYSGTDEAPWKQQRQAIGAVANGVAIGKIDFVSSVQMYTNWPKQLSYWTQQAAIQGNPNYVWYRDGRVGKQEGTTRQDEWRPAKATSSSKSMECDFDLRR